MTSGRLAAFGRAIGGGVAGLVIGRLIVRELGDRVDDMWWPTWAAAAALAIAFVAAPSVTQLTGRSTVAAIGLVTAAGLYLGVPETDHVLGLGVGLAVLAVAELRGRLQADAIVVMAVDAALVWTAVRGAVNRDGAVVAGLALLGLLLVAPVVVGGTSARRSSPRVRVALLVIAQFVFVVVVARNGALRPDASGAALVAVAGLVGLTLAARLVVAGRPR
jgi:hypothetical protein